MRQQPLTHWSMPTHAARQHHPPLPPAYPPTPSFSFPSSSVSAARTLPSSPLFLFHYLFLILIPLSPEPQPPPPLPTFPLPPTHPHTHTHTHSIAILPFRFSFPLATVLPSPSLVRLLRSFPRPFTRSLPRSPRYLERTRSKARVGNDPILLAPSILRYRPLFYLSFVRILLYPRVRLSIFPFTPRLCNISLRIDPTDCAPLNDRGFFGIPSFLL